MTGIFAVVAVAVMTGTALSAAGVNVAAAVPCRVVEGDYGGTGTEGNHSAPEDNFG